MASLLSILGATGFSSANNVSFASFLGQYGKSYAGQEYARREALFLRSLEQIEAQNKLYAAGQSGWFAGLNTYSDWSDAEFDSSKKGRRGELSVHSTALPFKAEGKNTADSVDWRTKGVVTPVKDQGGCGSCWAFASTETLESHFALSTGQLLVLAPQALVNCAPNPSDCGGTGGCEGSIPELAFNYTSQAGMPLESSLPYHGKDQPCAAYQAAAINSGYTKLAENDGLALEEALDSIGPIAVNVAANWRIYAGGIFSGGCSSSSCTIDHVVQAVGYEKPAAGKEGYWLIRNSWGAYWGEGGYIRLSRVNDATVYEDKTPSSGVACKPFPRTQLVGGESGVLFDMSFPTGLTPA